MKTSQKILVQCDFDGTVTEQDISFLLLDEFANGDWHILNEQYTTGKLTVGQFNEKAFGLITAGKETMLDFIKSRARIRKGFKDFVNLCSEKGLRLVIVSNGLEFYIENILTDNGLSEIEFHAAKTKFIPQGLKTRFQGPDGKLVDKDFKIGYVNHFLNEGYKIIYIGDGNSDLYPAKLCHSVFAIDNLLKNCRLTGIICNPFEDFTDITKILKTW